MFGFSHGYFEITDGLGSFWPSSSVLAISEKAVPESSVPFSRCPTAADVL